MKKTWNTPELIVYGPVQELTQKTLGLGDGVILDNDDENGGGDKPPFGNSL